MRTLREVADFTGVAGTAGQVVGQAVRPVGLRASGDLVAAVVDADRRHSLGALTGALPTLPPITLTARITAGGDDVAPGNPVIEVDPPTGAVVETVVTFFRDGVVQPFASSGRLVDGRDVVGTRFSMGFGEPGSYEAVVRRVGVTGTGVADLQRRLPFRVRPVPAPAPPPTPPAPPEPPFAGPLCGVELDGHQPSGGGITNVRVFGGRFVPGEQLVVLEDGSASADPVADVLGGFSVTFGLVDSTPPATHRFQAVSVATGATTNVAEFRA